MNSNSNQKEELCRVLLVEDDSSEALIFESWLKKINQVDYKVIHKQRLADALLFLESESADIVVLDLSLPDSMGADGVEKVRSNFKNTPVIVMSGQKDENLAFSTVKTGAQDYLVKDDTTPELLHRSIHYAIHRNQTEKRLSFLAEFDHLTKIPNRTTFFESVKQSLLNCNQETILGPAVLLVDLNDFKNVNGMYGHRIGDELLTELASRLMSCVKKHDLVARVGGDEFAILLNEVPDRAYVNDIAGKIFKKMIDPVEFEKVSIVPTLSIGASLFPDGGTDVTDLVQNANYATYEWDDSSVNQIRFYDAGMRIKQQRTERLKRDLKYALQNQEFFIQYQPILDVKSNQIRGFESLLRWRHPVLGIVSPMEFIDVLEISGDIVDVGAWVLDESCSQFIEWEKKSKEPLFLAVNVSPRQIQDSGFKKMVEDTLVKWKINPAKLELEITENLLMKSTNESSKALMALVELGVSFSMDDFGTGYSQLRYLIDFPISTLKIDRSIISALDTEQGKTITKMLLAMSKELNVRVVAEGIEEKSQAHFLLENDCDLVQGFLFSKPVDADVSLEQLGSNGIGKKL